MLILSSAGKPIFVRYLDSDDSDGDSWATACAVVQGVRANVLSFGLSGLERGASALGDICSVHAGNRLIVFMHTEAITLVAISDNSDVEAWMRLLLEYVYSQVLFTLTDQVQAILQKTPQYDLRNMIDSNSTESIRNLLDGFDGHGCASFLTSGIEVVHPIPPELRENASKLLLHAVRNGRGSGEEDLFAILVVGTKLVTIVQPKHPTSQLHTSDLNLILTFVGKQHGLLTNDLWFPICLPRFNSGGFLYAFTSCLDPADTQLSIILISPDNRTEQFESFRSAADKVREGLGLPIKKSKILRVFDSSSLSSSGTSSISARHVTTPGRKASRKEPDEDSAISESTTSTENTESRRTHFDDKAWRKPHLDDVSDLEDDSDTEDKGSVAKRISIVGRRRPNLERQLSSTNYLDERNYLDESPACGSQIRTIHEGPLLTALKVALSDKQQEELMATYCSLANCVHFVFRCDIYVNCGESDSNGGGSLLTQCFGPSLSFPFVDAASQAHVWSVYHKLAFRLRFGSASEESLMDALDEVAAKNDNHGQYHGDCPMQRLVEEPPSVHGVTYVLEDNEWLYLGLNGKYFQLYATLPATVAPRTGAALCARLVRKLMADERNLFLANPLCWNNDRPSSRT